MTDSTNSDNLDLNTKLSNISDTSKSIPPTSPNTLADANKDSHLALYQWNDTRLLSATASVHGKWLGQSNTNSNLDSLSVSRIATDTRKIQMGDIFLALSGDNFDGHHFLDIAQQKGAVAAIVSQPNSDITLPQLMVDDTRLALGQLAAYRRVQHKDIKIIAITGSSGKTSVKEMLRSIFEPLAPTLITRGNLNNDLGVPMMLLELQDTHRYAILELGANHVGEIAYTTDIVRPDVACILNIGTAHLGEFGGRDNIAKTKAEIYQAFNHDSTSATAVIPLDDDYLSSLYNQAAKHTDSVIGFGWQKELTSTTLTSQTADEALTAHLYAANIHTDANQNTFDLHISDANKDIDIETITLPLAGKHNISNALAAAACAYALGVSLTDIARGLSQARPAKGRLQWLQFHSHRIIDDTYNANPHSVKAAADVLAAQPNYKILILGDIGELGEAAKSEHQGLGRYIAATSIDGLFCVGEFAEDTVNSAIDAGMTTAQAFDNKSNLLTELQKLIATQESSGKTCTLLFKGSRSMTMETLIADLMQD